VLRAKGGRNYSQVGQMHGIGRWIKPLLIVIGVMILLAILASIDSERPTKRIEEPVKINAQ
jgi:hypothetical protein